MKNYDERIESIFKKYDERLAEKKRRKAIILRSCAIGAGAAAVLGVGLTTYALRPPKKPASSQSGIIVVTETTSAETTVAPTSPSTTATQTTSTKQVTTTTVSTTATTSSSRKAVTTVRTTTVAARTTRTAVTTTEVVHTTTAYKQTTVMATTQTQAATSAAAGFTTATVTDTSNEVEWEMVYYGDTYKSTYEKCTVNSTPISVSQSDVGIFYDAAEHYEQLNSVGLIRTPCKLYTYKDYSPNYVCAVKKDGEDNYYLYHTSESNFGTLGELIEGTRFEDTLVLKEAYNSLSDPAEALMDAPSLDELMEVLSDTSLKSIYNLHLRNVHPTCSYTIMAEVPELGMTGEIILMKDAFYPKSGYISLQILGDKCTYDVGAEKVDKLIKMFA
ncbi:MAG: hypothetical protein J6Y71_10345 [Ruminococcus sp.]|nr:hypothetical protein [Ruminococcus sp.]